MRVQGSALAEDGLATCDGTRLRFRRRIAESANHTLWKVPHARGPSMIRLRSGRGPASAARRTPSHEDCRARGPGAALGARCAAEPLRSQRRRSGATRWTRGTSAATCGTPPAHACALHRAVPSALRHGAVGRAAGAGCCRAQPCTRALPGAGSAPRRGGDAPPLRRRPSPTVTPDPARDFPSQLRWRSNLPPDPTPYSPSPKDRPWKSQTSKPGRSSTAAATPPSRSM